MPSTEWIWFNGRVIPMSEARIDVEDRGFQFADGVYEVVRLYGGKPFALQQHLDRLHRSAEGIHLQVPMALEALAGEIHQLVARSATGEGMVYLQLTRGVAPRNHRFPDGEPRPTLLFYCRPLPPVPPAGQGEGLALLSVPDERWKRCWIKSIALLPNVLARNAAAAAGCDEAVFIDDGGIVTECSASNFFAVIRGRLLTHPVGNRVLPGITRQALLELAPSLGIDVEERPLREDEARDADELFVASTTREINWVRQWDGKPVSPGWCGPVTLRLHQALQAYIAKSAM